LEEEVTALSNERYSDAASLARPHKKKVTTEHLVKMILRNKYGQQISGAAGGRLRRPAAQKESWMETCGVWPGSSESDKEVLRQYKW